MLGNYLRGPGRSLSMQTMATVRPKVYMQGNCFGVFGAQGFLKNYFRLQPHSVWKALDVAISG